MQLHLQSFANSADFPVSNFMQNLYHKLLGTENFPNTKYFLPGISSAHVKGRYISFICHKASRSSLSIAAYVTIVLCRFCPRRKRVRPEISY